MIKGNHKSRNIDQAKVPQVGAPIKSLTRPTGLNFGGRICLYLW